MVKIVGFIVIFVGWLWLHLKRKIATIYGLLRPSSYIRKGKLKRGQIDYQKLIDDMWAYASENQMPVIAVSNVMYHELVRLYDFVPPMTNPPPAGGIVGYYKGIPLVISEAITMRPGYYEVVR